MVEIFRQHVGIRPSPGRSRQAHERYPRRRVSSSLPLDQNFIDRTFKGPANFDATALDRD
jgi:hypothetical protein